MRVLKKVVYPTLAELEESIAQRKLDASQMQAGDERQAILAEIDRLRTYADMKRLLAPSLRAIRSAASIGAQSLETRAPARKSELN